MINGVKMEKIYKPKHHNCSEQISLKKYFEEYSSTVLSNSESRKGNNETAEQDTVSQLLGIDLTEEEAQTVAASCSPDQLTVPGEFPQSPHTIDVYNANHKFAPHPITEHNLKTAEAHEKLSGTLKLAQVLYTNNRSCNNQAVTTAYSADLTPLKDFIVCVRVYHPFAYTYAKLNTTRGPIMKFSHEIVILGSQTLAELRDKITCKTEFGVRAEVQYPSKDIRFESSADKYPSGFMFIKDTFYNDFRKEGAIDYSEVIRKWAAHKNIGRFNTANMNETRIDSLEPRFGYPYVYLHQAECEHIIMFTEARLVGKDELLDSKLYPYHSIYSKLHVKDCALCGQDIARWLCVGYNRLPHEKNFLCTECVISYNYENGKKIGDFKLYPFFHKAAEEKTST